MVPLSTTIDAREKAPSSAAEKRFQDLGFFAAWQSGLSVGMPGDMITDDLANYQIVVRDPVCFNYRGHNVCGMGPPSSGALAVGQILGVLDVTNHRIR